MENRKLKAKLVEVDVTYQECADAIGISLTSFNKKINDNKFYVGEMLKLSKFLNLTTEEVIEIFLH